MLIGEFAARAGLSQDTVRFYVRKGLLAPKSGAKGGRNPYQIFSERDVSTALMIRFAQSLGMSLKEVAAIAAELLGEGLSAEREIGIIDTQLARLEQKSADLERLLDYLHAKRNWMARGKPGDEPRFSGDDLCLAEVATPASSRATVVASEEDQA
ncbi:MerR family transcriptional regulator [Agrobacterium tumefaciens]|uniref:MerR family transcriptional regulator n=1 Tax=Agrobacterium tumefaciens TaxID=358 RepID=UPI00234227FD|nr:MerR family transcriptional regulator [Agrobacterium tumefaciens]WCK04689.1 MerR family transcriptional regulator [Agrobacterium tumefaciens]